MEQLFDGVIYLLQEINNVYTEMLKLSEKKQEYIVKADVDGINQVTGEEWKLLQKISELEENRMNMVREIQTAWGVAGPLTLAQIGERLDAGRKSRIEQIGAELRNTVAAQKKLNDENTALLRLHFEYIDFMMSNFMQDFGSGDIYGQSGTVKEAGTVSAGIIDSQI